ncbi:MAG: hypothetical protein KC516_04465 [Nanoarchaeota archaeon]|nr:hypothetical protein [Nanoarchaeota archaeon]
MERDAFNQFRYEIEFEILSQEVQYLREEVTKLKEIFKEIPKILGSMKKDISILNKTMETQKSSNFVFNQTKESFFKPLKTQNLGISIGNKGVQTDRQTDQQTDRQGFFEEFKGEKATIKDTSKLLDSLDSIKKELRLTVKKLTDQEFLVFSAIYQLEDEKGYADYKLLSHKLRLTESSIRDYVRRLIQKGIPLEKVRINNKEINITISQNLRKLASLDTLLMLKGL